MRSSSSAFACDTATAADTSPPPSLSNPPTCPRTTTVAAAPAAVTSASSRAVASPSGPASGWPRGTASSSTVTSKRVRQAATQARSAWMATAARAGEVVSPANVASILTQLDRWRAATAPNASTNDGTPYRVADCAKVEDDRPSSRRASSSASSHGRAAVTPSGNPRSAASAATVTAPTQAVRVGARTMRARRRHSVTRPACRASDGAGAARSTADSALTPSHADVTSQSSASRNATSSARRVLSSPVRGCAYTAGGIVATSQAAAYRTASAPPFFHAPRKVAAVHHSVTCAAADPTRHATTPPPLQRRG